MGARTWEFSREYFLELVYLGDIEVQTAKEIERMGL